MQGIKLNHASKRVPRIKESMFQQLFPDVWDVYRPNSQTPQCTCPISHNAPFRTEICTFLFWMVHCGTLQDLWDWCVYFNVALWLHISTQIWFSIVWGNGLYCHIAQSYCRNKCCPTINDMRSSDILQGAISQEIPQVSISKSSLKVTCLNFIPISPGTIELMFGQSNLYKKRPCITSEGMFDEGT